jgi:hypothetical protein
MEGGIYVDHDARRRRSGGGPGRGCARGPVSTYFYLHAVRTGNRIVVPCLGDENGRGLNGVPAHAIRVINKCWEAMYGGLCDEYNHATVHCMTLFMHSLLITIRAFTSEGRTTWVCRYYNLARVILRNVLLVPPGTYMYAQ